MSVYTHIYIYATYTLFLKTLNVGVQSALDLPILWPLALSALGDTI